MHMDTQGHTRPGPLGRTLVSVVTPCYNEEDSVEDCYNTVRTIFETQLPDCDFEHLFADNSSTDATVTILRRLAAADQRVKVIVNARNFGALRSNFNAVLASRGDAVVVFMPADLQDPPELIPEFVARWRAGHEVVYGIRHKREEDFLLRSARKVYYRLVSHMSLITIPVDVGEYQLVDRVVIEALRKFDDYYPYIRGMIANCGFRTSGVAYTWKARRKGVSKARFYSLLDQALNGLISFTNVPMRLFMFFGLGVATLSFLYALFAVAVNVVYYRQLAPPGIPTLTAAVFFFGGAQLFAFGVLGEYIAAIHFQVRKRPLVIERERINFDDNDPAAATTRVPAPHFLLERRR
jgi:glycosyltransferase involved in cell wall biosynthesis